MSDQLELFPYEQAVAEAQVARCHIHGVELVEVSRTLTVEQAWCGTWLECPDCKSSMLVMSDALLTSIDEQFETIWTDYQQMKGKDQRAYLEQKCSPWVAQKLRERIGL